jgi:hypothetical protein
MGYSRPSWRRISIAGRANARGAGLGNEVMALAKAAIAARLLNAKLVEQPWWINPRHYGRELGYNVAPPILSSLAGLAYPSISLPAHALSQPWDYERSMKDLAGQLPSHFLLRHTSGMSGGYLAIRSAREWVRWRLSVDSIPATDSCLRLGIHLRLGDFAEPRPIRPGQFNVQLPLEWVSNAVAQVLNSARGMVRILLCTDADAKDPAVRAILDSIPDGHPVEVSNGSVLADLRRLSQCDVLIPSVSSYSMLALFVADCSYLWPREALTSQDGWLSIWGHDPQVACGPTATAISQQSRTRVGGRPRGIPLAIDEQADLVDWLQAAHASVNDTSIKSDLLYFGVVREI